MRIDIWLPDVLVEKARKKKINISRFCREGLEKKLGMKLPKRMPKVKKEKPKELTKSGTAIELAKKFKKEAEDLNLPL